MKGMLCWLIVAMALAGCTLMWAEPTEDEGTYAQDLTFCHAEAYASAMMARDASYRRGMFAAHMRNCMHARGWPVKDE